MAGGHSRAPIKGDPLDSLEYLEIRDPRQDFQETNQGQNGTANEERNESGGLELHDSDLKQKARSNTRRLRAKIGVSAINYSSESRSL
jgi:hypothetical protein